MVHKLKKMIYKIKITILNTLRRFSLTSVGLVLTVWLPTRLMYLWGARSYRVGDITGTSLKSRLLFKVNALSKCLEINIDPISIRYDMTAIMLIAGLPLKEFLANAHDIDNSPYLKELSMLFKLERMAANLSDRHKNSKDIKNIVTKFLENKYPELKESYESYMRGRFS